MPDPDVSRETETGYLTTEQASIVTGVGEATIRKWVERGYLKPQNPGHKPSLFKVHDVWLCARDRLTSAQRRRLYGAWDTLNRTGGLSDDS